MYGMYCRSEHRGGAFKGGSLINVFVGRWGWGVLAVPAAAGIRYGI